MVNENLPQAVTYRRRDYEQDAMMRALCERNGVMLPPAAEHVRTGVGGAAEQTDEPEPEPKLEPEPEMEPEPEPEAPAVGLVRAAATSVFLVCSEAVTGSPMLHDLRQALSASGVVELVDDAAALASAERVLVFLSVGVLGGTSLALLEEALHLDRERGDDRLVLTYAAELGWSFGCAEQKGASATVREALDSHEAVTYRPRDEGGRSRHEFPAMVAHLLCRLAIR
jgi:hypothetical protein